MYPVHSEYNTAETLVFPNAITLKKILLSGKHPNGSQAIFEDIVEPGVALEDIFITIMTKHFSFWRANLLLR